MKRNISFFLCISIIISTILMTTSCNNANDNSDNSSTSQNQDETNQNSEIPKESSREDISDDLPENNYDGYNFRVYTYDTNSKYVIAEEEIGEVINDAIFSANLAVEERFNVKITELNSSGDDGSHVEAIKRSIKTGDDVFDLAFGHDTLLGGASLEGYFYNLYDIPAFNFEKPWWPEHTVKSLTLQDQMYVFSNAISYLGMQWTRVLFMNKDKAQDYSIEMPYNDVFNGTWTIDKLISLTKDVYTDINGNGEVDQEDFFGYSYSGPFYCSLEPFGIEAIVKDDAEILKLNINNERTLLSIDKMYELLFESKSGYYDSDYEVKNTLFKTGKSLFIYTELGAAVDDFRFTDTNYGILPMGKLDESQEKYYAGYTDKLFVIPNNPTNVERTGTIVEAMSAEGYKKVFPAYYEVALKNKYLQDEESIRVLDLINESRVLDFAYIYSPKYSHVFTDLFSGSTPNKNFTSYYEKSENAERKKLDKIIASFEKMQG